MTSISVARVADAIRQQAVQAGQDTPTVRGADWRTAVVATVGTDGTVTTTDGIVARRLGSYASPAAGDRIAVMVSGNGNWLAAGRMATSGDGIGLARVAYKTADTSRTSAATPASDPHLTLTVSANAVYTLEMALFWTGGDAGDLAGQFSVPSGTSGRWVMFGPDLSMTASGTTAQIRLDSVGALASKLVCGSSATSRAVAAQPAGLVAVGATGGQLTWQWSQNTSDSTATTLLANSWMKLTRVS